MKDFIYIGLAICMGLSINAQVPTPAPPQSSPILLKGGYAHLGNGEVIENSVIGFDDGKLTIVTNAAANVDESGFTVVDISGQHVYPGIILPNSQVGLSEVGNIRQMQDDNEEGDFKSNVRALIAYNTDSEYPPTFRYNGVLLAESTPTGGRISGNSSVMELDGWNWEDAAHTVDVALHLNWPSKRRGGGAWWNFLGGGGPGPNPDYGAQVEELNKFFLDAKSYADLSATETNLKLEAMKGLFDGTKTLMIHSDEPKEIVEAVKFAQNHQVRRIALISDQGALHVADFLASANVPVILTQLHSTPDRADDDYDLSYKLPYLLAEAGVTVVIGNSGSLHGARNLPFQAGTAAAFGVDKEEALRMITLNTAAVLGIDGQVGSLEVGKDATLFVSKGDALDMRTNILSHAFISGREVILDNKQQDLYKRFSEKYGHTY